MFDNAKSIHALASLQEMNGSYLSLSADDPNNFSKAYVFPSVFSNTLILNCLTSLSSTNPKLSVIKEKLFKFVLSQRSKDWTFNYWARESHEYKKLPYPDDLDDTFCALASIYIYDKKKITGKVLAKVVSMLTTLEIQEGGPYRTWIVSEADTSWHDVDIAVNANIAYFLSLLKIRLKNLQDFFDQALLTEKITSPYYPENLIILYFLARWYKGKHTKKLQEIIKEKKSKEGHWGNPLYTSLAVLSLMQLGEPLTTLQEYVAYIIASQKDFLWEPTTFYTGVNPKHDKQFYAGSKALSTAFCLLAIDSFQKYYEEKKVKVAYTEKLSKKVYEEIKNDLKSVDPALRTVCTTRMKKIIRDDTAQEIVLLPHLFNETLKEKVPEKSLIMLGKANAYGWLAYTIYDDFFDDEGKIVELAAANMSLRRLSTVFQTIVCQYPSFGPLFTGIMDRLDAANLWELQHCRGNILDNTSILPTFSSLDLYADRAMGHALGPVAILCMLGQQEDASDIEAILTFFKHYLIARQLNDDAHDFEEDIKKGHLNAVNIWAYQDYTEHTSDKISLPQLQKVFWHKTILTVCEEILNHVTMAEKSLEKTDLIVRKQGLLKILNGYRKIVSQVREERKKTLDFLAVYD